MVWIFMDSLRFDTFNEYSSVMKKDLTESGIILNQCITQGAWTYPSTACFLSAKTAINNGVSIVTRKDPDSPKMNWPWVENLKVSHLRPEIPTLFDYLSEADYEIFSVCSAILGEEYHYRNWNRQEQATDDNPQQALDWLRERTDKPFCLFFRTNMTHCPWRQLPQPFDWESAKTLIRELGENRRIDEAKKIMAASLSKFEHETYIPIKDTIQEMGLLSQTIIIIMSDHGDSIWENYDRSRYFDPIVGGDMIEHNNCYEENIHAVAGFFMPSMSPQKIDSMTRLIDLVPTIGTLLSLKQSEDIDGVNLFDAGERAKILIAPTEARESLSVRTEKEKIVYSLENQRWACFDLENDPDEMHPEMGRHLENKMLDYLKQYIGTDYREVQLIDEQITKNRLKSLGYL